MHPANDLSFVRSVLSRLEFAGIEAWLFGGWAEELRGLRGCEAHGDIDLLYPAGSFELVDGFLANDQAVEEIKLKHFSHKRAFTIEQIAIEIILVQNENSRFVTDFFSGLYTFYWPEDTFQWMRIGEDMRVPVASENALRLYRQQHPAVEQAYQAFRA